MDADPLSGSTLDNGSVFGYGRLTDPGANQPRGVESGSTQRRYGMSAREEIQFVIEGQESELERALVREFLHERGYTFASLHQLSPKEEKHLLTSACVYASIRLEEMHEKARMARELHGASEGCGGYLTRQTHKQSNHA